MNSLGYQRVDDRSDPSVLVDNMAATAQWEATIALRRWEKQRLGLKAGTRVLDVGCGRGDALLALAADVAPNGELVGIDESARMIETARAAGHHLGPRARFRIGNAYALEEPAASFDRVRSERVLQWLADPQVAVNEMARVLRTGGRLSLIDTDWSTLTIDIGDERLTQKIRRAMNVERNRASNVGRRLRELMTAAGLRTVEVETATQHWTSWDPHVAPAPFGCFSMKSLAADLASAGELDATEVEGCATSIEAAAREGRFRMALTMHAAVAVREG